MVEALSYLFQSEGICNSYDSFYRGETCLRSATQWKPGTQNSRVVESIEKIDVMKLIFAARAVLEGIATTPCPQMTIPKQSENVQRDHIVLRGMSHWSGTQWRLPLINGVPFMMGTMASAQLFHGSNPKLHEVVACRDGLLRLEEGEVTFLSAIRPELCHIQVSSNKHSLLTRFFPQQILGIQGLVSLIIAYCFAEETRRWWVTPIRKTNITEQLWPIQWPASNYMGCGWAILSYQPAIFHASDPFISVLSLVKNEIDQWVQKGFKPKTKGCWVMHNPSAVQAHVTLTQPYVRHCILVIAPHSAAVSCLEADIIEENGWTHVHATGTEYITPIVYWDKGVQNRTSLVDEFNKLLL